MIDFSLLPFANCLLPRCLDFFFFFVFARNYYIIFIKLFLYESFFFEMYENYINYIIFIRQFRQIFWIIRRVQIWWWGRVATFRCVAKQQGHRRQTSPGEGKTASWLFWEIVRKVNYLQTVFYMYKESLMVCWNNLATLSLRFFVTKWLCISMYL